MATLTTTEPAAIERRVSRGHALALATFLSVMIAACGLAAFIGLAPMRIFQHDVFFYLDNAYRVLQGQVPHRDFGSAWGPITYLMEAAGLILSGMRPDGIGYANAVFGALIAIWAYCLGRARLYPAAACALGIYTVLLTTAPFPLGWGVLNFGPAMTYNRYGFGLLAIIIVERATQGAVDERQGLRGAVSTGAAFALLGFLKVSYAFAAVPFLLLPGGPAPTRNRRFLALCVAAAAVGLVFLCYLRFDLTDLLNDMRMAASGRSKSWRPREILPMAFCHAESIPISLLAVAVAGIPNATSIRGWIMQLRWLALAIGILGLQGFLLSTNHQPETLALNGCFAIILTNDFFQRRRGGSARSSDPRLLGAVVCFLAAICVVPLCFWNAFSLVAAARTKLAEAPQVRLDSARGASMFFDTDACETETGGPGYVIAINDGLSLLRRRTGNGDGVLALDMFNPFNYLLERPSPVGGVSAAAYNYVISDAAHPSSERFFGNARYVMLRKYSSSAKDFAVENYHIQAFRRLYQDALERRFRLIEETEHWRLYGLR